jgi:trimeric autotransporter adhesin
MKPTIKFIHAAFALFAFACFALLPQLRAALNVAPPPDGCYPGFTTAEGCNALNALTSGAGNTGLGWYSLHAVTTGSFNTGVGAGTLALNTGSSNTAVGTAALLLNTGTENVAIGTTALIYNETGGSNTAVGNQALYSNTTGNGNVAAGYQAAFSATTDDITAFGYQALFSNLNGTRNTGIGNFALQNTTTGNDNTALGNAAGRNLTTGDNNIDIGWNVVGVAGESNTIRIGIPTGASAHTATYIGGIFGATPGPDALPVGIDTNGQLGTIPSSPSTQAVVTGSRALNTVFQNTGSTPRFVSLTSTMGNGSSAGYMNALTDANNPPTTEVARVGSGAVSSVGERSGLQVFFIVLPGNYYKVSTTGTVILHDWTEWQ